MQLFLTSWSLLAGFAAAAAQGAMQLDDPVCSMQMAARTSDSSEQTLGRLRDDASDHSADAGEVAGHCPTYATYKNYNVTMSYTYQRREGWVIFLYKLTPLTEYDSWEGLSQISFEFPDCKCVNPDIFTHRKVLEYTSPTSAGASIGFRDGCEGGGNAMLFNDVDGGRRGWTYEVGFTLMDPTSGFGKVLMGINENKGRSPQPICGPICNPQAVTTTQSPTMSPTAPFQPFATAPATSLKPFAAPPASTTSLQPFAAPPASTTSLRPFAAPPASTTSLRPFASPGLVTTTLRPLQNAPMANPQAAPLEAGPLDASPLSPVQTVTTGAPPAAADAATTFGDPHVGNLKGEKFNILNPSTYKFLVIPRGADEERALLHVTAKVQNAGQMVCNDVLFITALAFTGQWLGATRSLAFSVDVDGDVDAWKAMRIRTGSSPTNLTMSDFKASVSKSLAEVTEYQPSKPRLLNQHVTTLLVKLNLGLCTSKVRVVFQKEKVGFSNSLWLSTTGLRHVQTEIGGILGLDDHEVAASIPSECADPSKGDNMRPIFGRSAINAFAGLGDEEEGVTDEAAPPGEAKK